MTSAVFTINGTAVPCAVSAAAGSTVTLTLTDLTGAVVVQWTVDSASEDTTLPTLATSGALGQTATFTMPAMPDHGRGLSFLVRCTVIDGSGAPATMRGIVGLAAPNGLLLVCYGEQEDRRPEGWAYELNYAIAGAGWGRPVTTTAATYDPTVGYCNAGLVIYGGAASSGQVVTLPDDPDLEPNTAVLVVASHANVSSSNTVEVQGTAADVALETVGSSVAYLWDGSAWQLLSGGTGGPPVSVTWGSVTGKPDVVEFDDATDGTVPNGTGAGTGAWTATPKVSRVRLASGTRPLTTSEPVISNASGSVEMLQESRLQTSVAPVATYAGDLLTDSSETGVRDYVSSYATASAPSTVTVDFDLTYVALDSAYQPNVAIDDCEFRIVASSSNGTFSTWGHVLYTNYTAVSGNQVFETDGPWFANQSGWDPVDIWTFTWSTPAAGTLRLTATPGAGATRGSFAVKLSVLGSFGRTPNGGT